MDVALAPRWLSHRLYQVDGLEWESADHFSNEIADEAAQKRAAEAYDADPKHWARRVEIAMEIVQSGLDAAKRGMG